LEISRWVFCCGCDGKPAPWAGAASTLAGVVLDRRGLFDWGLYAYRVALGQLQDVHQMADRPSERGPEQTEIYGVGVFLLAGSKVFRLAPR
jgi:hypothetical protein